MMKLLSLVPAVFVLSNTLAYAEDIKEFYDPTRVIEIEINTGSWDTLRLADPVGGRCNFDFIGDRYEYLDFEDVHVNGIKFTHVGVKKKSWCGSESKDKPALTIKFDKFDKNTGKAAKEAFGTDSLVLNNSLQDPSIVRQCLSYEMFAKAGIASPLCNFAHVRVNGQDMGVYVNLQPLKKDFFRKHYGANLGNLYEISGESLETAFIPRIEANLESMKKVEDTSLADIRSLMDAVSTNDLARVKELVDVDQFLRYWATEIALAHSDGLMLGNNNGYLYFPENGKMQTVPWGTDRVLASNGEHEAKSIYTHNHLANVLANDPKSYAKLTANVKEFMAEHWDVSRIHGYLDGLVRTVKGRVRPWEQAAFLAEVETLKKNIRVRPQEIESFINKAKRVPQNFVNLEDERFCLNTQKIKGQKVANVWTCADHPDQKWEVVNVEQGRVRVRNTISNNCLNVQEGRENGRVGAWSCNSHPDQTWKRIDVDGSRMMFESERVPGLCLSMDRPENMVSTILRACDRSDSKQVWQSR